MFIDPVSLLFDFAIPIILPIAVCPSPLSY